MHVDTHELIVKGIIIILIVVVINSIRDDESKNGINKGSLVMTSLTWIGSSSLVAQGN